MKTSNETIVEHSRIYQDSLANDKHLATYIESCERSLDKPYNDIKYTERRNTSRISNFLARRGSEGNGT